MGRLPVKHCFLFLLMMLSSLLFYTCTDNNSEVEPAINYEPFIQVNFIEVGNVGLVKIDCLTTVGNDRFMHFEDSASVFNFPLPVNYNNVTFLIYLSGRIDSLGLSWNGEIKEQFGQIDFLLTNINLDTYSSFYDSVRVECDSICLSNEAVVKAYY